MSELNAEHRFYKGAQLQLIVSASRARLVFGMDDLALAERHSASGETLSFQLATQAQRSLASATADGRTLPISYSCYGSHRRNNDFITGFTGQYEDAKTECYILGNGYRPYSPILMRFLSPDTLSPFAKGGVNSYAYCNGDPVNNVDPSGHMFKAINKLLGLNQNSSSIKPKHYDAAVEATNSISELREQGEWYKSPHVTNKHLKKAGKLGAAHKALETLDLAPSLRNIMSEEDYRYLAQLQFEKMKQKTLTMIQSVNVEKLPAPAIEAIPALHQLRPAVDSLGNPPAPQARPMRPASIRQAP